jgi:hypothetical protein
MTHRIAMWSGPRNISTAMMRAWGNRNDTFVCDEPLYAHYLNVTRKPHPGWEEVIAAGETDARKVTAWLTGDVPEGKTIFFQKHMAHHLLPGMNREWIGALQNVLLVREPREMLTSLIKATPDAGLEDTGLPQQAELFAWLTARDGAAPAVIDARDVLENPRGMLKLLCERIGVPFDEAMLAWPPGPRATDGVWAKHWYHEVEKSTSFRPYKAKNEEVPAHWRGMLADCERIYAELYAARLTL